MLLLDIHSEAVDLQRKHQVSNISLTVLFGWCKILPLIDLNWVVMVLWQKRKVKRNVILSLKTVPLMHLCVIHFIWQSLLAPLFAFELIRMRAYWPLIRLRGMRGSCFRIMWHEHDFFCQHFNIGDQIHQNDGLHRQIMFLINKPLVMYMYMYMLWSWWTGEEIIVVWWYMFISSSLPWQCDIGSVTLCTISWSRKSTIWAKAQSRKGSWRRCAWNLFPHIYNI